MDPTMQMMGGNMKQFNLSPEEIKACHELQATAFLNNAICWHLLKEYEKAESNAKKSLLFNKSIKAHYRLGQSQKALKRYDDAIKSFKAAIMMDTSDPNDIQSELVVCERLEKANEKKRL